MKKLIIFALLVFGVWWGWKQFFSGSGTDLIITDGNGNYKAEAKISNGKTVELKEHLIPGRYTVFFFYADW